MSNHKMCKHTEESQKDRIIEYIMAKYRIENETDEARNENETKSTLNVNEMSDINLSGGSQNSSDSDVSDIVKYAIDTLFLLRKLNKETDETLKKRSRTLLDHGVKSMSNEEETNEKPVRGVKTNSYQSNRSQNSCDTGVSKIIINAIETLASVDSQNGKGHSLNDTLFDYINIAESASSKDNSSNTSLISEKLISHLMVHYNISNDIKSIKNENETKATSYDEENSVVNLSEDPLANNKTIVSEIVTNEMELIYSEKSEIDEQSSSSDPSITPYISVADSIDFESIDRKHMYLPHKSVISECGSSVEETTEKSHNVAAKQEFNNFMKKDTESSKVIQFNSFDHGTKKTCEYSAPPEVENEKNAIPFVSPLTLGKEKNMEKARNIFDSIQQKILSYTQSIKRQTNLQTSLKPLRNDTSVTGIFSIDEEMIVKKHCYTCTSFDYSEEEEEDKSPETVQVQDNLYQFPFKPVSLFDGEMQAKCFHSTIPFECNHETKKNQYTPLFQSERDNVPITKAKSTVKFQHKLASFTRRKKKKEKKMNDPSPRKKNIINDLFSEGDRTGIKKLRKKNNAIAKENLMVPENRTNHNPPIKYFFLTTNKKMEKKNTCKPDKKASIDESSSTKGQINSFLKYFFRSRQRENHHRFFSLANTSSSDSVSSFSNLSGLTYK